MYSSLTTVSRLLDQMKMALEARFPRRNQAILLICLSGERYGSGRGVRFRVAVEVGSRDRCLTEESFI